MTSPGSALAALRKMRQITCPCGTVFTSISGNTQFCPACRILRRKAQSRDHQRRLRAALKAAGR